MPKDKSVISIPSTSKVVVFPNVAANFSTAIYNEGIYISKSSALATYPKSVVRIYKNPSNPKKIYFAAKDTSLLENYVLDLINKGQTKDSNPNNFRSDVDTAYFWSRVEDEDSYRDFSSFSQPRNLEFESSQAINKSINLYTVPLLSQQVSYMSSLNTDAEINNLYLQYGIFLKAKSSISDYESYDLYSTNKATINRLGTSDSWLNRVGLYEKFLFNQLTSSSDIESDLKKIQPLYEKDLQLNKSVKILNVNKIVFSNFISNNYTNIVLQKIIIDEDGTSTGGEGSVPSNYVIWKKNSESDGHSIIVTNAYNSAVKASNDFPDGLSLNSLKDKIIYLDKSNYLVSTIRDNEVIDQSGVRSYLNNFKYEYARVNSSGELYYDEAELNGSITINRKNMFSLSKELSIDNQIYYSDSLKRVDGGFTSINESNLYVFKDSFNYSNYGFIPQNPSETIYEFEIDQELDIENGTFVVAEIN